VTFFAVGRKKWQYYPNKSFLWFHQFQRLVGTSVTIGNYTVGAQGSNMSGADSTDTAPEDEPVIDSEERARFDFQEMRYNMEETVQHLAELDSSPSIHTMRTPAHVSQSSAGTSVENRISCSGKRKSSDAPTESSRSRRIKSKIAERQNAVKGFANQINELVKNQKIMIEQNAQFLRIQTEKSQLPSEVIAIVNKFSLNVQEELKVWQILANPIQRQYFMNSDPTKQMEYMESHIAGFIQKQVQNMQHPSRNMPSSQVPPNFSFENMPRDEVGSNYRFSQQYNSQFHQFHGQTPPSN
jgi:hypothetical protein